MGELWGLLGEKGCLEEEDGLGTIDGLSFEALQPHMVRGRRVIASGFYGYTTDEARRARTPAPDKGPTTLRVPHRKCGGATKDTSESPRRVFHEVSLPIRFPPARSGRSRSTRTICPC